METLIATNPTFEHTLLVGFMNALPVVEETSADNRASMSGDLKRTKQHFYRGSAENSSHSPFGGKQRELKMLAGKLVWSREGGFGSIDRVFARRHT